MALEHFYTIRERKKNNILDAIEKCMQTQNYDKLSINDIVVAADISRGSFYNYFADKSDAVDTLVKEKINGLFNNFKECIVACNGNLFDGVYLGYNQVKDNLKNKIFRTIMKNLKFFVEIGTKIIYSDEYENDMVSFIDWLIDNTNEGKEILNTREKMANVVDLFISLLSNIVLKIVISDFKNNEEMNSGFDYKFNIIKVGVINSK